MSQHHNATPYTHPFANYLLAKRSVDDRALHPRLWQHFITYLDEIYLDDLQPQRPRSAPIHILELGCGIGTMLERLLADWSPHALIYTALDNDARNLEVMAERLSAWATAAGYTQGAASTGANSTDDRFTRRLTFLHTSGKSITLRLLCADAYAVADLLRHEDTQVDALIAHAFLDLVETRPLLTDLRPLLTPAAHLYCTINFDGLTVFEPPIDSALDAKIERLYHATMDAREVDGRPAGHSQTGRRLFHDLRASGYEVLDMGSSDWTVFPGSDGYAQHEAAFLHHILDFVAGALHDSAEIDRTDLDRWITTRRRQIAAADLFYMAHQLDYLARPAPRT